MQHRKPEFANQNYDDVVQHNAKTATEAPKIADLKQLKLQIPVTPAEREKNAEIARICEKVWRNLGEVAPDFFD